MKKILSMTFLLGAMLTGCNVPQEGFLSYDGIQMREDTVEVIRGLFQLSAIPQVDGSTRPISFEITRIKNLETDETIDLGNYEINMWTKAFDARTDTTMDLVNEKLVKRSVSPIEINSVSGQMAFNGATQYITEGEKFGVDVFISNRTGETLLENFCLFKLIGKPFETITDFGDMLNGIPATGDKDRVGLQKSGTYTSAEKEQILANTHPNRRLTKVGGGDVMQLIMVVRDAEGKPFKGEDIIFWPSGASYLNNYHDNSLAMNGSTEKVILTDTSCIFTFPTVPYPAFGREYNSGTNLYLAYYCIRWDACKFSPAGQKLLDDYLLQNPGTSFVTYSPRFRNGYKINETGTWLMEMVHPYVLKKN